ncbi:hypothetical protein K402DRAFT_403369 [Aulographum hederae CBS 113979]|uniref:N-acetyltransferase domain-containing protein n=1 Tax=Aulographum hederae CBS 113979 TaxID=1176131 RepID=A0A6G1H3P4_9PEZI|nr:hypothetical protein K402DRAFT_403369 [Aulographum hederae CBS 113979]
MASLDPRYEIRQLTLADADNAAAIVSHANMFDSPVWPEIYPTGKTARCYQLTKAADYLVKHQINSGFSFGVFDKEYEYKRPESAATNGKLHWDFSNEDATAEELLEQMDFPLVSVAAAYDGANALDMAQMGPLIGTLPVFGVIYAILGELDTRDPESWKPKGPKGVLMRNATATRRDYAGEGLMKALAHFLMRKADEEGFRAVNIECMADAVTKVWLNPPSPYRAELVAEFWTEEREVEEEGKMVKVFEDVKQHVTKVCVHL